MVKIMQFPPQNHTQFIVEGKLLGDKEARRSRRYYSFTCQSYTEAEVVRRSPY